MRFSTYADFLARADSRFALAASCFILISVIFASCSSIRYFSDVSASFASDGDFAMDVELVLGATTGKFGTSLVLCLGGARMDGTAVVIGDAGGGVGRWLRDPLWDTPASGSLVVE